MASITTGIQLADNFSAPLMHVVSAVNMTISAIDNMNHSMNAGVDTTSLVAARNEIAQAAVGFERMEENIRSADIQQKNLNGSMSAGSSAASNLAQKVIGMVGAYVSIHSAVNAIKDVLSAENTQIEAETKLTTVMQQRMGATDQMVQSVKDLTAAQQGLGVVGDEVQMAGAQQMATFLNNSDALQTLIPAMNNLAVQQNGVAVSGENMKNIANMMGKAMQGQVSALTRVGITMTDAEQKALKNGNEMERAAMLAQIITNNVGNMNEAIASTPQGMMQQLSNTWGDMKEVVGGQLYPAVYNLFHTIMENQTAIESVLSSAAGGLNLIINVLTDVVSVAAQAGTFISNNWQVIGPVVYGVVAALAAYATYVGITNAIDMISTGIKITMCVASYAHAAATGTEASATAAATAAQYGLNTAMLSCPLTWIVVGIMALIIVLVALCNHFSGAGHIAQSAFGVVTGSVNVAIQYFKNLGLSVADVFIGIWNAAGACATNVETAFHNSISHVQTRWYNMLSTALTVVSGICSTLNKLPFVEFDYSGITSAADNYASKAAAAAGNTKDYTSVTDAFNKGIKTYDVYQSGWAKDAYTAGAAWGDGVTSKIKNTISSKATNTPSANNYPNALASSNAATAANTADTAKNTAKTANTLSASSEDLKYLRDIADREYVNKFTTAQIKVEMINHNNVNNDIDLDGMAEHLRSKIEEEMNAAAEGEH
jgi:hypothetical protein